MPRATFEQLRLPLALLLIAITGFVLWPRGTDLEPTGAGPATPGVIVGEPGGAVITAPPEPSMAATPIPTLSAAPTPEPTPDSPPPPVAADGFSAEVLVCRSISGSTCHDRVSTLPDDAGSFTALVRFTRATRGDTINAVLSGPSGTLPGGAYTLQGGGDGYYYSTFQAGALPSGKYTVTATRNGDEVATTTFSKGG